MLTWILLTGPGGQEAKGRIPSAIVLFLNSFFRHLPAADVGEDMGGARSFQKKDL